MHDKIRINSILVESGEMAATEAGEQQEDLEDDKEVFVGSYLTIFGTY